MILAIDTLTPLTSICVGSVSKSFPPSKDQAELLMGQIKECLEVAGSSFEKLTCILVLTGPGSFTGMRVGLSAAHGIGLALGIPVFGVSAMRAFSLLLPRDEAHYVFIDSRRKDVAMAFRDKNEDEFSPLTEMEVEKITKILDEKPAYVSGNGLYVLPASHRLEIHTQWIDLPRLIQDLQPEIASLPTGYHAIGCEPVYLRAPDVTISKDKFEHQALCSAK